MLMSSIRRRIRQATSVKRPLNAQIAIASDFPVSGARLRSRGLGGRYGVLIFESRAAVGAPVRSQPRWARSSTGLVLPLTSRPVKGLLFFLLWGPKFESTE